MLKSNCLAGGRLLPLLRKRLEDLAILRRLKARYQLQVCNPQPEHSKIQSAIFGKPLSTCFQWHIAYFTVRDPRVQNARGRVQ